MSLQDAAGNALAFISGTSPQQAAQQAALSPASIERRRKLADAMLEQGSQYSPIQSPWQGVARVTDAIMGGLASRHADEAEVASRKASSDSMASTLAGLFGGQGYGAPVGGNTPLPGAPAADAGPMGAGPARPITSPQDAADAGGHPSVAQAVNDQIPTSGRALLDTIAGTESPNYNTRYGGATFDSFADHPRIGAPITSGPNAGRMSAAAGRYQFLPATWDAEAQKLGLKDFSPASQDAAAWDLAQTTYKQQTGQDLSQALQSGDPRALASVGQSLHGQWTSLPGGIEAGTNTNRFAQAYAQNFGRYGQPQASPAGDATASIPPPLADPRAAGQVASLDPSIGMPPGPQAGAPVPGVGASLSPQDMAALTQRFNQATPPASPAAGLTDAPVSGMPPAGPAAPITPPVAAALQQAAPPGLPPAAAGITDAPVPPGALVGPPGVGGASVPPQAVPQPPVDPRMGAVAATPMMPPQAARPGGVLPPDVMNAGNPRASLLAALQGAQLSGAGGPPATLAPNRAALADAMAGAAPAPPQAPQNPAAAQVAQAMAPTAPAGAPQGPQGGGQGSPSPQAIAALSQIMNDPWADPTMKQMAVQTLMQRYAPHKMISVSDGAGGTRLLDELTGQQRGYIPGHDYKTIKNIDGSESIVDAADQGQIAKFNGGQGGASNGQNPFPGLPMTDTTKDYAAIVAQAKTLGVPPPTLEQYQLDLKKAGAQSVTIAGEAEESKALGAARAKNIVGYMDGGKDARDKLQSLQIMEDALKAGGGNISTGPGAEMILNAKQALGNLLGENLDGVAPAEMVKKMGAYLASSAAKSLTARPTQFDFKTFLANNPGLDISPQGNQFLISVMKQQAQHEYDLSRLAQSYKGNTADWNDVVEKYDQEHPISSPITGKPLGADDKLFPSGGQSAQPQAPAAPPERPKVNSVDEYNKLPSGTEFVDPMGDIRRKP